MKPKNLLIYTLCAAPICLLLRILQNIYIVDTEGNYVISSFSDSCLRLSLAALLLITAVFALVYAAACKSTFADMRCICSKRVGIIYIIISALMLVESGLCLGEWFASSFEGIEWVGITGLLAAVYYAVQGMYFAKEQNGSSLAAICGFFPPAYFCIRGIVLFFDSFKHANISSNRLEMLTVCSLALLSITLSAVRAGAKQKQKRVAVTAMLTCIYALTPLGAQLIDFFTAPAPVSPKSVLWFAQTLLFAAAAFIILLRVSFFKDEDKICDPEPIVFDNGLNVYIDDIPE